MPIKKVYFKEVRWQLMGGRNVLVFQNRQCLNEQSTDANVSRCIGNTMC